MPTCGKASRTVRQLLADAAQPLLQELRHGTARRIDKPGHKFSRIHVDDIASVLRASMAAPRAGAVYNVCDDGDEDDETIATTTTMSTAGTGGSKSRRSIQMQNMHKAGHRRDNDRFEDNKSNAGEKERPMRQRHLDALI